MVKGLCCHSYDKSVILDWSAGQWWEHATSLRDISQIILDSHSFVSVQDLFYAPAAEQEVKTLFQRLDDPIGDVPSQQLLSRAKAICQVSQILAQWGRHSLRQGALRMHLVLIPRRRPERMAEKTGKKFAKGSVDLRSILSDKVLQCDTVQWLRESKTKPPSTSSVSAVIYTHSPWMISALFLHLYVIFSSWTFQWTMHFLLFSDIILYSH